VVGAAAIIFRVDPKFLVQKPAAKGKKNFFVFIKRKKRSLKEVALAYCVGNLVYA